MSAIVLGEIGWSGSRDKDGHREYRMKWLIDTRDVELGPAAVFNCPGLPSVGSSWSFFADHDPWAYCWPNWTVQQHMQGQEKSTLWTVEQLFSTKPLKRCQDSSIESPLAEPPKISGSFAAESVECHEDRFGNPFRNSALEQIRGKMVEFDETRPSVRVEMNIGTLPLGVIAAMANTVNDSSLWGLGSRMIKLSSATWQRQLYGTCSFYFTVVYEFEANGNTWDRRVLDEGTMCLLGWAPGSALKDNKLDPGIADLTDPKNFEQYKDINGENTRVFLDGQGRPVQGGADPAVITLERYAESNFLLLGIPATLT